MGERLERNYIQASWLAPVNVHCHCYREYSAAEVIRSFETSSEYAIDSYIYELQI